MGEKLKVAGAAGGAVGLGGFAAALGLCCGVPWAVALLGVTGAVALARLAFLLPYALAGAAVLLGFGFWLVYREPACDGDACDIAQRRRPPQWLMWVAVLFVFGLAVMAVLSRVTTF
ncbi:MAG: mercuric transporter MerT family protein [Steroidobacteraceae bacterium]